MQERDAFLGRAKCSSQNCSQPVFAFAAKYDENGRRAQKMTLVLLQHCQAHKRNDPKLNWVRMELKVCDYSSREYQEMLDTRRKKVGRACEAEAEVETVST